MATLFVFGAGASAFSGPCSPKAPPLGNNLFDELKEKGGIAATIDGELANAFRENFERGMSLFRRERGAEVTAFLREMADYFARFEPGDTNLYVQLLREMTGTRSKFAVATLNYELLIELAATRIGRTIAYTALSPGPGDIPILKPHGSCNFLPDVAPRRFSNFSVTIPEGIAGASILETGVRIANARDVIKFCAEENAIAPALALYEEGKSVLFCPAFVREQQLEFDRAAEGAKRIFVIGVRVVEHDRHIWLPIARSKASLYYVGPDASELFAWARRVRRRGVAHIATSFAAAIPLIVDLHNR